MQRGDSVSHEDAVVVLCNRSNHIIVTFLDIMKWDGVLGVSDYTERACKANS